MQMICQKCGKFFNEKPARVKTGRGKYCSVACKMKMPDKQILIDYYFKQKLSLRSIAKILSCSVGSVKNWLNNVGRYCRDPHDHYYPNGENHPSFKRGFFITKGGYKFLRNKATGLKEYEHRIVMERKLGRQLGPNEVVHHIDRDTLNNSLENLSVMTKADHFNLHKKLYKYAGT